MLSARGHFQHFDATQHCQSSLHICVVRTLFQVFVHHLDQSASRKLRHPPALRVHSLRGSLQEAVTHGFRASHSRSRQATALRLILDRWELRTQLTALRSRSSVHVGRIEQVRSPALLYAQQRALPSDGKSRQARSALLRKRNASSLHTAWSCCPWAALLQVLRWHKHERLISANVC